MNTPINFSSLESLAEEQPSTLMGCIRMAWPHIRAAREHEVTLKIIHKRLNDAGIPISYKLLAAYVARLQQEDSQKDANALVPAAA
jgi:hypothetical protein